MRQGKKRRILLVLTAAVCSLSCVFPSKAADWELQEDGKRWKYMIAPDEPLTDTWLTLNGKEYYLDTKGYMKTGWVKDNDSNESYYLGEDGAKCYNMFTPDNQYVGPEGTALKKFDTYRKSVTKRLESFLKKGTSLQEGQAGFLLADLNGDCYPDLAVFDGIDHPNRVLLAAIWNPGEEEFADTTMSDPDSEAYSVLSRNPDSSQVWLTVTEADGNRNYFSLENGGFHFVNEWNLETGKDDWGEISYFADGEATDFEEWNNLMEAAEKMAGESLSVNLLPLDEGHILQAVNRAPENDELYLWE